MPHTSSWVRTDVCAPFGNRLLAIAAENACIISGYIAANTLTINVLSISH